ncbi:hypothetical protein ACTFIW_002696 [Dictyostelium discoideum]
MRISKITNHYLLSNDLVENFLNKNNLSIYNVPTTNIKYSFNHNNIQIFNELILIDYNNNNKNNNNKNQQIRDMYILYKLVMEISTIKNNLKYDDIKFEWMVNNNQYKLLFDKIVKSNPSFNFKFDLDYNYNPKNLNNLNHNNNNNILYYFIKFFQIIQPINENNQKTLILFYNNNKHINIIYNNLKYINNSLISQLLINDLINDEQLTIDNKISFQSLIDLILKYGTFETISKFFKNNNYKNNKNNKNKNNKNNKFNFTFLKLNEKSINFALSSTSNNKLIKVFLKNKIPTPNKFTIKISNLFGIKFNLFLRLFIKIKKNVLFTLKNKEKFLKLISNLIYQNNNDGNKNENWEKQLFNLFGIIFYLIEINRLNFEGIEIFKIINKEIKSIFSLYGYKNYYKFLNEFNKINIKENEKSMILIKIEGIKNKIIKILKSIFFKRIIIDYKKLLLVDKYYWIEKSINYSIEFNDYKSLERFGSDGKILNILIEHAYLNVDINLFKIACSSSFHPFISSKCQFNPKISIELLKKFDTGTNEDLIKIIEFLKTIIQLFKCDGSFNENQQTFYFEDEEQSFVDRNLSVIELILKYIYTYGKTRLTNEILNQLLDLINSIGFKINANILIGNSILFTSYHALNNLFQYNDINICRKVVKSGNSKLINFLYDAGFLIN